jgi:hypothetical protein
MAACSVGCGSPPEPDSAEDAKQERSAPRVTNDRSLCAHLAGQPNIEVVETSASAALHDNVRRVYRVRGVGPNPDRVLLCRESDSNLDGYKDIARLYDEQGTAREDRADTNFNGKVDTWGIYSGGQLVEVRLDRNHDGYPDEWKTFSEGRIHRIKRDTNFDRRPDVWEMYKQGRLDRMGVDLDGDQRIDRWDRDTIWKAQREAELKRKRDEARKRREQNGEAPAPEESDDGAGEAGEERTR